MFYLFFFFQAEDGIRDLTVTGVQTCALPISARARCAERHDQLESGDGQHRLRRLQPAVLRTARRRIGARHPRSEEHTSELQSQSNLVCRLLLEKKNDDIKPGSVLKRLDSLAP